MVFTKLLLENAHAIRPCNFEAASEPLLPKVARCIPVLPSRYIGKCAARVLRVFIGVETAALTFRTKQYSTSYSSHICYAKRFYNDFFLNHHTTALVNNCLKLLCCVVIETALDLMKKDQLS